MADILIPIALSSQLDTTGEERIHAAGYAPSVRPTFALPPRVPLYVVVGDGGKIYTSLNWFTQPWILRGVDVATASNLLAVEYGNNVFVAVGNGSAPSTNTVRSSSDGFTWLVRDFPSFASSPEGLCFGGGLFVCVGSNGSGVNDSFIFTTPDGINWTSRTVPPNSGTLHAVTYGESKYVAVSDDGIILYSSNGADWTSVSVTGAWYDVTYSSVDSQFMAVGGNARVATSPDGVVWTEIYINGPSYDFVSVGWQEFFGYVAVSDSGPTNGVYYSADGTSWTLQTTKSFISGVYGGNSDDATAYALGDSKLYNGGNSWSDISVAVGITIYGMVIGGTPE